MSDTNRTEAAAGELRDAWQLVRSAAQSHAEYELIVAVIEAAIDHGTDHGLVEDDAAEARFNESAFKLSEARCDLEEYIAELRTAPAADVYVQDERCARCGQRLLSAIHMVNSPNAEIRTAAHQYLAPAPAAESLQAAASRVLEAYYRADGPLSRSLHDAMYELAEAQRRYPASAAPVAAEPPTRQPGFEATYRTLLQDALEAYERKKDVDAARAFDSVMTKLDAHVLGSPAAQLDAPLPDVVCGLCGVPSALPFGGPAPETPGWIDERHYICEDCADTGEGWDYIQSFAGHNELDKARLRKMLAETKRAQPRESQP